MDKERERERLKEGEGPKATGSGEKNLKKINTQDGEVEKRYKMEETAIKTWVFSELHMDT